MSDKTKCPGPCSLCGEEAEDRCEQLTGPCCHVSLTFEECVAASIAKHKEGRSEFTRNQDEKEAMHSRLLAKAKAEMRKPLCSRCHEEQAITGKTLCPACEFIMAAHSQSTEEVVEAARRVVPRMRVDNEAQAVVLHKALKAFAVHCSLEDQDEPRLSCLIVSAADLVSDFEDRRDP